MAEGERVESLIVTEAFRLERITSEGHVSPPGFWYDQDEYEWVTLVSGAATLELEGGVRVELRPGDTFLIEPHRRHRVTWTSTDEPTVWLALFFRDAPSGASPGALAAAR